MNSCLYKALVMHNRLQPKQHRFHYKVFMFYIDLDEIAMLKKRFSLFSHNKFNFFSFMDREHLQLPIDNPNTAKTTKQHIIDYLYQNGVEYTGGRIMLLTNLNILGYNFNPVSFYFCFDEKEQPIAAVAEVSNTFREMKPYFLGKEQFKGNSFHLNTEKCFYVSPFLNHDLVFDFNLTIPAEKLNIKIDDYKEGNRFFISTLTGTKKDLTNARLLAYSLGFPLMTLRIMFLIHWQAMLLWLKKIPYHRKAANPHLQRDVYNKYKAEH